MNWNKYLLTLFFAFISNLVTAISYATTQEKDLLVYEGARYFSRSLPALGSVLSEASLPEFSSISTENWKGYRATWAIIQNQLFLVGIEGSVKKNDGKKLLNSQELFPTIRFPYKVTNFNGVVELEGRSFDYEIINGDIVETLALKIKLRSGKVEGVTETTINRKEIARNKGKLLYESSSFRASYERKFVVSDIQAGEGKTYGVNFEEAEWNAKLSPKSKCPNSCVVNAIFPINEQNEIDASLESFEISDTLLNAFNHPFVLGMFKNAGATGIRLRVLGDRLHWNTSELQELHKTLKGQPAELKDVRDWAYIIIDDEKRKYTSIYYNRKTGEVMLEDNYSNKSTPRLIREIKEGY
ncbi:hypothetical protein [uncultured Paraglaciecola sp.]|uniref:hypothetical protein n=1 Tax=uncultured Paraglaciecola sp. TaxID=1765024 RepID=UPI0026093464|nr:hypothetical protein [uncultured Paraglaciecola sp.]